MDDPGQGELIHHAQPTSAHKKARLLPAWHKALPR